MPDVLRIEDGDALGVAWPGAEPHLYRPGDDRGAASAFVKAIKDGVNRGETPEEETSRDVARLIAGRYGIRKDASGNLILAWWVPQELAESISVPGGVPAADMHCTLLYLGDPNLYDVELVAAVAKLHASTHSYRCEGWIGGMGRFVGPEDEDVIVALLDVGGLDNLRRCLRDDLFCNSCVPAGSPLLEEEHGYVPHITLSYVAKTQASPPPYTETTPITIDNIAVAAGSSRVVYEIRDDKAEYAADAVGYYAAKATSEIKKAGRVLSAASLMNIRAAVEAMKDLLARAESKEGHGGATGGSDDDTGSLGNDDPSSAPSGGAADLGKDEEAEAIYVIEKSTKAKRYTLGPLYAPNRKDAHGEWTDPETLQEAVWDYVRLSADEGRLLHLQHGDGEITVGEWVEVVAWPYDHAIKLAQADGTSKSVDMPEGTIYMGVIWHPEFWDEEKGAPKDFGGYSLGGRAVKVTSVEDFPLMG